MKIQIETTKIDDVDFPKKDGSGRWFKRSQQFLLFKDGENYPDKGELTLSFSDNRENRDSVQTLAKGTYEIDFDKAMYIDKSGNLKFSLKTEYLKLVQVAKAA